MSINYYGVTTANRDLIGQLVEGTPHPDAPAIDVVALRKALIAGSNLEGKAKGTLTWKDEEGGYVFVDVSPTCALITQSTGGSDDSVDVLLDIISVFEAAGISLDDPQQGSWFPGSPVQPKQPAAKKPAAKKPVAKKPVAKKPAAKKPAAKKPVAKKPTAKGKLVANKSKKR